MWWFLPYVNMNQPWVHVSHPEPPSHLPPQPYPSGLSQSTGFECPVTCIELALVIYFTYGDIHVPGEGNGNPLQYSCLEKPMDRGACKATVYGVARGDTTQQLNHHHHDQYTCFNAILSNPPTLAFSHRVQKSVLYICDSSAALHIGVSFSSF